ncbi:rod-binding protein [Sulfitobacter sabulilitoris]|uniref:Flagellar protein FlgJ N-terminal domain-containing protein n=1 Tax=Sulfitobacter sabulilitoris TaxID=2562655 RepID=A0A5S3PER3_9RHOB|nr:rod-binding protein [Sulfitobacter sabulilitoris]TMM52518.1 hypothetical protein FDT80_09570 [Sulfitobacter sabulilitoris]
MIQIPPNASPATPAALRPADTDSALRDAARSLEATFLAEMLKSAGFGEARDSFGGGAGEDQFASFMVQEHATQIVRAGGIGLAESLYLALKERQND